jgi:16S rRNA (cytosine967-C5)-methyltransferase
MLARENEASVDAFEAANSEFRPVAVAELLAAGQLTDAARAKFAELADGARLRLSSASADTDGFFAAVYERTA